MQNNETIAMSHEAALAGSRVYSKPALFIYDYSVLWFSNTFVWQCPARRILEHYNRYISNNHLDIGVGTGYFLDKCRFPSQTPSLAIADLNQNSLQTAAARLSRYNPKTYLMNVLEPIHIEATFDSVGLGYVLHCLPGATMRDKEIVFQNLKPLVNQGGMVFGTTILGKGVSHNFLAKKFLDVYNRTQVFSNRGDSYSELQEILSRNFKDYSLELVGCVAFFAAHV